MAYVGRDFSPAETAESILYGLDLVNDIGESEVLISASWSLAVRSGTDANPASHLIGGSTLVTPEGTTRLTATTQRISGLLPNVLYTVRVIGVTGAGNTVSLWTHIQGEQVE